MTERRLETMEKKTVLFVDDEENILKSLKRGLLDEPYETLFAQSGKEALEILKQKEVHVLVTDMRMPEMSGLELLKITKTEYPHIIRMVLSGYTQVTTLLTAINQGEIYKFITKPWKLEEEFKPSVREAVEYYEFRHGRDRQAVEAGQHNKDEEKVPAHSE
jgi:two-component system response regulator HupR/HoxA